MTWDFADGQRVGSPVTADGRDRPLVAVVDNYDSFTYNLVHGLVRAGARCVTFLNDFYNIDKITEPSVAGFVLSAGPCTPKQAGLSVELVQRLVKQKSTRPLLGVCLGHQVIAHALGGTIERARRPIHGKLALIRHDGRGVFTGLPNPLACTQYNSLVVRKKSLPAELLSTGWNRAGELMALRHVSLPIEGIQFHPESALSTHGPDLLRNWVRTLKATERRRRRSRTCEADSVWAG